MAIIDNSNNNKENGNLKEKLKDVKYRAKMELVFYGVFIVALVCLANVNVKSNNSDSKLDNDEVIGSNDMVDDNQEAEIVSLYEKLRDSNYAYEIKIVGKNGEESFEYLYTGKVTESGNSIAYLNQVYDIVEDKFYISGSSEEVMEEVLFPVVSYNYLDFLKIDKIISKGKVEYKTNYSNGNKAISYVINLNDLFFNDNSGNSISILRLETSDEVSLEMDYRYLVGVDECQVMVRYFEFEV